MLTVFETRAATVLFNLISSQPADRCYIVPANACPIVLLLVAKARRDFMIVDIDSRLLSIRRDRVLDIVSRQASRPFGLVYIRPYGTDADPSAFFREVRALRPDTLIVDDRCLCAPDFEETLTPEADAVVFSTGPRKVVDMGFGGFGRIRDDVPYASRTLPLDGPDYPDIEALFRETYDLSLAESDWLGTNRPVMAWPEYSVEAVRRLGKVRAHKERINRIYDALIPDDAKLPPEFQKWRYNILAPNRTEVLEKIFAAGLFAGSHYQPLSRDRREFENAYALHEKIINLFNDFHYTDEKAEKTASIIANCLQSPP